MSKPFNPIRWMRKNQGPLMVGLVLAVIFSFTVGGIMLNFFGGRQRQGVNTAVVSWKGGTLKEDDLTMLNVNHVAALRFINAIIALARQKNEDVNIDQRILPQFASSEEDLLFTKMLAERAKEVGMVVSDEAIESYLERVSDDTVEPTEYRAILAGMEFRRQPSLEQIYDQLRIELLAMEMGKMAISGIGIDFSGANQHTMTALDAWESYKRLHRQVKLKVQPFEVADYVSKVQGEPTEAELKEIYDDYKDYYPSEFSEDPGFRRPKKLAIQYVEAKYPDFLEEEKKKFSDEVVKAEYDRRVALGEFKVLETPGTDTPTDDGEEPPFVDETEEPKTEEPKTEEPKTEEPKTEEPKTEEPKTEEPKTEEPKTEEPKTEDPKTEDPKTEDPKTEDPKTEDPKNGDPKNGDPKIGAPTNEEPKTTEGDPECLTLLDDADPTDETKTDASETTDDPASENNKTEDPDDSKGGDPDSSITETPDPGKGADPGKGEEPPAKVKPLEEVRDEILDSLASADAKDAMDDMISRVEKIVELYAQKRAKATPEDRKKMKPLNLATFKQPGVTIGKTDLVDQVQMRDDYEIGKASSYQIDRAQGRFIPTPFHSVAFQQLTTLYSPRQFATPFPQSPDRVYVFWATQHEEDFVPEFEDIRKELVEVWKTLQARELAKAAAEKRAAEASQKKTLGDAAKATDTFTWMRPPLSIPGQPPSPPTYTTDVENVEKPGQEFMETTFSLEDGEIGAAPNLNKSIYYVMQVENVSDTSKLMDAFLKSPPLPAFAEIQRDSQVALIRKWRENLNEEMKVDWLRSPRSYQ